jgi:signal peptidase
MRIINYAIYGALLALAILTLGFFVLVRLGLIANPLPSNSSFDNLNSIIPRAYIVQSGSMSPAIKVGSIVITQKSPSYLPNDIITFNPGGSLQSAPREKNTNLVTHRILFKNYPEGVGGPASYLTAGDANEEFDRNEIKEDQIVGKVVATLPYAGYIADFAKKPYGFILLVIVPATIIIYEELKFLKREFGKSYKKLLPSFKGLSFKGSRTITSSINFLPLQEVRPLHKASIFIPMVSAFSCSLPSLASPPISKKAWKSLLSRHLGSPNRRNSGNK